MRIGYLSVKTFYAFRMAVALRPLMGKARRLMSFTGMSFLATKNKTTTPNSTNNLYRDISHFILRIFIIYYCASSKELNFLADCNSF